MLKNPKTTAFKFILTPQQLFNSLDHIKLNNYQNFINIGKIGKQIQTLSKQQNIEQIQKVLEQNYVNIQFMQMEIKDAFISALHLRNYDVIKYYLENGIDLDQTEPACILQLCYALQYLRHDPPLQLLQLLLQHKGNARYAGDNSDTAMHIAAKYGNIKFMDLLIQYGGDVNAVNDQKCTPLGQAISAGNKGSIEYLKKKNANQKWNQ